jgi:hypothetical protein
MLSNLFLNFKYQIQEYQKQYYLRNRIKVNCIDCGIEKLVRRWDLKELRKYRCAKCSHPGEFSGMWKGGRGISNGYVIITDCNHPFIYSRRSSHSHSDQSRQLLLVAFSHYHL